MQRLAPFAVTSAVLLALLPAGCGNGTSSSGSSGSGASGTGASGTTTTSPSGGAGGTTTTAGGAWGGTGGAGATGAGAATGAGGTTGAGGGIGGDGGTGTGTLCAPGSTKACYDGPAATKGVGACKEGVATCATDGQSYGPCEGQVLPAPATCASPADEACTGIPDCGAHLWSKRFGDANGQYADDLAVDTAGDLVIVGDLRGTVDFGGGALKATLGDGFLVKLSGVDGSHLWSRLLGGGGQVYQRLTGVALTPANDVVVLGDYTGSVSVNGPTTLTSGGGRDYFAAKYAASGALVWGKTFGGAGDQASEGALGVNGTGVVAIGAVYMTKNLDYEVIATKLDKDGNPLWSHTYTNAPAFVVNVIGAGVDNAGNVTIFGDFTGNLDFGLGPIISAGSSDLFLLHLDPNGVATWNRRIGNTGGDGARSLHVDGDGKIHISGNVSGTIDFGGGNTTGGSMFVASFDGSGALLSAGRYCDGHVNDFAFDAQGLLSLGGDVFGSCNFGGGSENATTVDLFVARRDAAGAHLWSRMFAGPDYQYVYGLGLAPNGDVIVAGYLSGSVDLGGGLLTSAGDTDVLVARLAH